MAKIGILFGSGTGNTERTAAKIRQRLLAWHDVNLLDVADPDTSRICDYPILIVGVSTWGNGVLQDDWTKFADTFKQLDLEGKILAFFGLGDQDSYPATFVDGMGIVYDLIRDQSFTLIGSWPVRGYTYESSRSVRKGSFIGLVIDEDNQPELTNDRINRWTTMLLKDLQKFGRNIDTQ